MRGTLPSSVCVLMVLLAGCSSPEAGDGQATESPAPGLRSVTCTIQETGQIGVTAAMMAVSGDGEYQMMYDTGANVTGFNVTLRWEASSPLTEQLNLTAGSPFLGMAVKVQGPSPLTVSVDSSRLNATFVFFHVRRTTVDAPFIGPTNATAFQDFSVEGSATGLLPESAETPPRSCMPQPGPHYP